MMGTKYTDERNTIKSINLDNLVAVIMSLEKLTKLLICHSFMIKLEIYTSLIELKVSIL